MFKGPDPGEPEQLAPSHLLLDTKLQEQGGKEELPASAFLFEMLTFCKDPCRVKKGKC
jgi:hypothetical protein